MCRALQDLMKDDIDQARVSATIDAYREYGESDEDIIAKIMKKFNVTKEYVQALLSPQVTV